MERKKKIGLVVWLGNGNYGTSLQAFALNDFLIERGYDVSVVDKFNYKYFSIKGYIKALLRALGLFPMVKRMKGSDGPVSVKQLKLKQFIHDYFNRIFIETPWQYNELLGNTDVFCVGSDQVWNAYHKFTPFNFLDFAGNVKRISYASSMGTKDFPAQYKDEIRRLLLNFNHISLREETGRNAVSELTGRTDVKTVLDPTFLLPAKKWKEVGQMADIEIEIPQKYMLVYLIGDNPNYNEQIYNLRHKTGIKNLIIIPAAENPDFHVEGAIEYKDAAMSEFVYLLEHAEWLCTDSFHATALSINHGKNFTEFLRFRDTDKGSQNSRIYDVLNTFGLQNRLYIKDTDEWSKPIDFTHPFAILSKLRKGSSDWLINAIEH